MSHLSHMTHVLTQAVAAAAAEAAGLGAAISEANATAAGPTSGAPAAAADEVSAATATLFSSYARQFQAAIGRAGAFHREFARLLAAAGTAYVATEAAAASSIANSPAPVAISLIMTGTGTSTPPLQYLNEVYSRYISPSFTTVNVQGLTTPEQLYPLTGVKSLTLDQSLSQGVTILDNAITSARSNGITPINVFGYSQSAVLASLEMPKLVAAGVPSTDVNFVLIGDPVNPNGGIFARFPGLTFPTIGGTFYGGTPANDYPTVIYTGEYDGYADFPRYPIDVLADVNALLGVLAVHGAYPTLTTAQLMSATQLPTSGPTGTSLTTYEMIPTQHLPLLNPVRLIPYLGNPVADLLEPDLTYLVNWGYGDPAFGYSTGPADVNTPFGFLPPLGATTALAHDLVSGTQQGILLAANDFHAEGLPSLPSLSLSGTALALPSTASVVATTDGVISGLQTAITHSADMLSSAVSTAYGALLPTADIVTGGLITLPSYDVNLFLDGVVQAVDGAPIQGLVNAIGYPIAADTALVLLGLSVEALLLFGTASSIVGDFGSI